MLYTIQYSLGHIKKLYESVFTNISEIKGGVKKAKKKSPLRNYHFKQ